MHTSIQNNVRDWLVLFGMGIEVGALRKVGLLETNLRKLNSAATNF